MASISVILNPIDKERLLLFYRSGTGTLSLDVKNTTWDFNDAPKTPHPTEAQEMGTNEDPIFFGSIVKQSQIATVFCNNLTNVYGFTYSGQRGYTLTQLSPYYHPYKLGNETPTIDSLSACSDGKANGWLHYIRNDRLVELKISLKNATNTTQIVHTNFLPGTALGSVYDIPSKKRYVIYQGNHGHIVISEAAVNGASWTITTTPSSFSPSPLAICSTPRPEHPETTLFCCYYRGDKGQLYRSIVDPRTMNVVGGETQLIAGKPSANTQFTVAPLNDGTNVLYYLSEGGHDYVAYRDTILWN